MNRLVKAAAIAAAAGLLAVTGFAVDNAPSPPRSSLAAVASGCPQFISAPDSAPAFCETFDNPSSDGGRAGQLNGTLWGTSMVTGAQPDNGLASVQLSTCGSTAVVNYPQNVQVCNGQLVETTNDAGTVSSLAMYPRQPFDFAGRTGTVEFDVSNNSAGNHAAWPEFWITDQPVPDPFSHEATWQAVPQNGLGIRFAGCTDSSGSGATCSQGQNAVGVDSAETVSNYAPNDSFNGGSLKVVGTGSVLKASGPGQVNHYEIRVSQSRVDVYGTDAFTPGQAAPPLVHIATMAVNLTFTRGVVWLEDAHYNGNKFADPQDGIPAQRTNTFTWDNLAFDGPILPRDLGVEVPNPSSPNGNVNGSGDAGINTAFVAPPNGSVPVTVPGVTGLENAQAALLEYDFYSEGGNPATLSATVNGHAVSVPWPFPDGTVDSPRTIAIPVPLADLTDGDNAVTFRAGAQRLDVFNVDLILAGAGGGGDPVTTTTTAPPDTTTTAPATTTTTEAPPDGTPLDGTPCVVQLATLELGECTGTFTSN